MAELAERVQDVELRVRDRDEPEGEGDGPADGGLAVAKEVTEGPGKRKTWRLVIFVTLFCSDTAVVTQDVKRSFFN